MYVRREMSTEELAETIIRSGYNMSERSVSAFTMVSRRQAIVNNLLLTFYRTCEIKRAF